MDASLRAHTQSIFVATGCFVGPHSTSTAEELEAVC